MITDYYAEHGGKLPASLEEFNALPEPYRRQIAAREGMRFDLSQLDNSQVAPERAREAN